MLPMCRETLGRITALRGELHSAAMATCSFSHLVGIASAQIHGISMESYQAGLLAAVRLSEIMHQSLIMWRWWFGRGITL